MPELKNHKWELFARAYISNYGNVTQAAIDAGYTRSGASNQGSRLAKNLQVRARIKELSEPLDTETRQRMEDSKAAIYKRAWELASAQDPKAAASAVQALRLIMDMQLLGPDAIKLNQLQEKNDMERERLELQKKQLETAGDAKNVSITLDASLMDAIK